MTSSGRLRPSSLTPRVVAGRVKARMGFFFIIISLVDLGSNLLFSRELDGKISAIASPSLQSCVQQVFGLKEKTGNRLERSWNWSTLYIKISHCIINKHGTRLINKKQHLNKCLSGVCTLRVRNGGYTPWPCTRKACARSFFRAQIVIYQ